MGEFGGILGEFVEQLATSIARNADSIDEEIMTLDNASAYLLKQKNLIPGVKDSAITISEEKSVRHGSNSSKKVFVQLLLDENGNPIVSGRNTYYGRTLYICKIDEELEQFLNGKSSEILRG